VVACCSLDDSANLADVVVAGAGQWQVVKPCPMSHSRGCDSGTMGHTRLDRGLWMLEKEPICCYCIAGWHDKAVLSCGSGIAHGERPARVAVVCGG
jgi:hypothetical protein